jgi:hypothetical protein
MMRMSCREFGNDFRLFRFQRSKGAKEHKSCFDNGHATKRFAAVVVGKRGSCSRRD